FLSGVSLWGCPPRPGGWRLVTESFQSQPMGRAVMRQFTGLSCYRRCELILKVEDLGEGHETLISRDIKVHEVISHGCLPPRVHLGLGHCALGRCQIVGLDVADDEAIGAQEERVVVPARCRKRL